MHAWGEWIVKETGIEGFRFDAIKHMDEVPDFHLLIIRSQNAVLI